MMEEDIKFLVASQEEMKKRQDSIMEKIDRQDRFWHEVNPLVGKSRAEQFDNINEAYVKSRLLYRTVAWVGGVIIAVVLFFDKIKNVLSGQ